MHSSLFCKVEESMENLLDVLAERDDAVSRLETGKPAVPEQRWELNQIGIGHWKNPKPHYMPRHMNNAYLRKMSLLKGRWTHKYLRLLREKKLNRKRYYYAKEIEEKKKLKEMFPNADID